MPKNKKEYNQTSISMGQDTGNPAKGETQNDSMGMQSAKLNPENFKGLWQITRRNKIRRTMD